MSGSLISVGGSFDSRCNVNPSQLGEAQWCISLIYRLVPIFTGSKFYSFDRIFSRSMTRAEGTKESRTRVSERGFFLYMVALRPSRRACLRACLFRARAPICRTRSLLACAKLFCEIF